MNKINLHPVIYLFIAMFLALISVATILIGPKAKIKIGYCADIEIDARVGANNYWYGSNLIITPIPVEQNGDSIIWKPDRVSTGGSSWDDMLTNQNEYHGQRPFVRVCIPSDNKLKGKKLNFRVDLAITIPIVTKSETKYNGGIAYKQYNTTGHFKESTYNYNAIHSLQVSECNPGESENNIVWYCIVIGLVLIVNFSFYRFVEYPLI